MFDIKTILSKLEKLMMAVTYAEAGEQEIALEIMGRSPTKKQQKRIKHKKEKRTDRRPVLMA